MIRDYMNSLRTTKLLEPEEEQALARRVKTGDEEALRELVRSNLRFVVKEAKRFRRPGVNYLDLIAEGNLGLIKAARDFDPERGLRFVTYAAWWVRESMAQFLAKHAGPVALPAKKARLAHKIEGEEARLGRELGRTPRMGELAASLKVDADELRRVSLAARHHVPLEKVPGAAEVDGGMYGAEDGLHRRALRGEISALLGRLPPRERQCVRMYFGLAGGETRHFGEIGPVLGLGREGTRLLFHRAMKKLQGMPEFDRIRREWCA